MNVPGMSEVLLEQGEAEEAENETNTDELNDDDDDDGHDDSSSESAQEESVDDDAQNHDLNEDNELHDAKREDFANRRCDLLWQGVIPKRLFTGFKFQESKSSMLARKFLETKNVAHYWDMVENADAIESSTADIDSFF